MDRSLSVLGTTQTSHLRLPVAAKRRGSAVKVGALLDATLLSLGHPLSVSAMVDSGADENFIDSWFAFQVAIALEQLPSPLAANALDGQHLARIIHRTKPLELIVSGNHHDTLQFHVILSSLTPLVLGHPWLKRHNPQFDWSAGKVAGVASGVEIPTKSICTPSLDVEMLEDSTDSDMEIDGFPEDHGSVHPASGNLPNLPIWNGPSTDDTSSSGCDTCSSAIEERFNHNTTTTTTSSFLKTHSKAEFQALYEEQNPLGKGGYGSVWAGYRKQDNRQSVAIKHIPMKDVVMAEGNDWPTYFPLEIALMLKVQGEGGSASPGAAVLLLDWFNLDQELILVLERPVLSTDLLRYMKPKGYLEEQEAKMIMQQVIKAITDIHSKGVLHRDIKPENILIETGSDVPRVRIIDFGCGCLLHNGEHHQFSGTFGYCPPEWFEHQSYRAEPLNVWQVGVLAYRMLVGKHPFSTKKEIISKEPCIGRGLSPNCQEFVLSCLAKQPQERLPLDSLLAHPWLR